MFSMLVLALVKASEPPMPMAWGFGTSALQIEGAWNEGGKGLSIWDKWYNDPKRAGSPNHFVATDHYHRYKEDIGFLGQLKATAYRFSISWPRIIPNCDGVVNEEGIQFYSNLIDEIIKNGALPFATLFHWDTPQACHDRYQSWLDKRIVEDFTNYADVIFERLGDRLEYILTINEPSAECGFGFEQEYWPPGVNGGVRNRYICQHWSNLAHGSVVQMAKRKHSSLNLKFGMPLIVSYGIPLTDSAADAEATDKFMREQTDWNWGPITGGDYPDTLKASKVMGQYLPVYTEEEKSIMRGTMDFIALNYYSATYVQAAATEPAEFTTTLYRNGAIIGPTSGTDWQNIYPPGIRGISNWVYNYYKKDVIIAECGTSVRNEKDMTLSQRVEDSFRYNFFAGITEALNNAVNVDKVPVKAFLAWALLDNFEWNTYDQVFGLISVDQQNMTLNRTIKHSAIRLSTYFENSVSPFKLPDAKNQRGSNKNRGTVAKAGLSVLILLIQCFQLY